MGSEDTPQEAGEVGKESTATTKSSKKKKKGTPVQILFHEKLPEKANSSKQRLRKHLSAAIVIRVLDKGNVFTLDWSKEDLVVLDKEVSNPACTVSLNEGHLMEIADGTLNPQVAMLSDKVEVEGQMDFAVYVFNLISSNSDSFE